MRALLLATEVLGGGQAKEVVRWLEHEGLDAGEFATAPVGFTAGRWPVWVTVCGGEANAADFILSMELGRLVSMTTCSRLPPRLSWPCCSFALHEGAKRALAWDGGMRA
jgi:hypothetical protein